MNPMKVILLAAAFACSVPAFADDDDGHYSRNRHRYISHEKAAQLAAGKIGQGARIDEVEFENSRYGGAYFEVEVQKGTKEYKVVIDAESGRIISAHRDY